MEKNKKKSESGYTTLFPIKRDELRKFFSMAALMFLILLNQNLIRGVKDSLVVTLIGAEVLGFIKLFIEMPVGILFVTIYTILCNKMKEENIFRIIILFFLIFFISFAYFLFPYQNLLHPDPCLVKDYVELYPSLKWFFIMWGKWTLVLFYTMGELWPIVIFSLLYWQLANKITNTEEASRFYFFFNLFGQTNLLISGSIAVYFSYGNNTLSSYFGVYKTGLAYNISSIMGVFVLLCISILCLHRYIEKCVMTRQIEKSIIAPKLQLGLWKSFKMIARSKYLQLIFTLMFSYSMVINLIEGLWFHKISLLHNKDPACFIAYQGKTLLWTGVFSLICSLLGNTVIRKLGWLGAALVTPVIIFIIGNCFFLLVVAQLFNLLPDTVCNMSTIAIIVVVGSIQNVLSKGVKYCFFDVTREMAYIPLDKEMNTKGKAAVDVLGGKIGKSVGAILQVVCYTIFSSAQPDQLSPLLMIIFCLICIIWIISVKALAKKYHKLVTASDL